MHAAEADARRTCGPWRGRCSGRARSCRRRAGRRSTGSGSALRIQLAHGEELEDAPLDLVEAVWSSSRTRRASAMSICRSSSPRAARPASRDRCASSRTRPRPRACAQPPQLLVGLLSRPPRGMPASAIAFSRSSISAACAARPRPAPSGSSQLLAQQLSRWRLSIVAGGLLADSRDSRSTSRRYAAARAPGRAAAELERLQDLLLLGRADVHEAGDQIGQLAGRSCLGPFGELGGACGSSPSASSARSLQLMKRASISGRAPRARRPARRGRPGRGAGDELEDPEALLARQIR